LRRPAPRVFFSPVPWWIAIGLAGMTLLPWYALEDGFFSFEWIFYFPFDQETAPAILQGLIYERSWLLPIALPFLIALASLRRRSPGPLIAAAGLGLIYAVSQGYAIGPLGFSIELLDRTYGPIEARQFGMGAGASLTLLSLLMLLSDGLARNGLALGDRFVAGSLVLIASLVVMFVVLPVGTILLRGIETEDGRWSLELFLRNLASDRLWAIGADLGVAIDSLLLAVLTAFGTTVLGLCCALAATRTRMKRWKIFRLFPLLPIITPPFVLGLSIILLFGRSGAVTAWLETRLGVPSSRYIFGLPGVLLAQLLAFTPVAFLILTGALEAVSPTLEEAAQTLRASSWRIFRTVTLPLIRPGIANAFLVGFVESLADFGNPLVLGGTKFQVLATEIYFAIAGAQSDSARASAMAFVLLLFTLGAFWAQRRWMKGASYATVGGKGDAGLAAELPPAISRAAAAIALTWTAFTLVIYGVVIAGGFVASVGRDHTLTLAHYRSMFSVAFDTSAGLPKLVFSGGAWPSLFTTVELAVIAAPLTAILGLITAWLIARQSFRGRTAFELATMLSFAVPGTVIGVAYVLAFNVPPFELTGTASILVMAFVFRNMPVGIRAGLASLAQIDKSLDEASLTLGASSARTLRRVVLPLVRPAVTAGLVYGFARAMTAVSAVIFLVSAEHNLATTYILGRVESGEYGPAIACSSALILLMAITIGAIQRSVGSAKLGRRVIL
jgi:iron(III) transport system permease protein